MIYFFKANDRVKIGKANDPKNRLMNLQTSCPYKIEPLLIIAGGYAKEKYLHNLFKEYNIINEWFILSDEILNYIAQYMKYDVRFEFGLTNTGEYDLGSNEQVRRLRLNKNLRLRDVAEKLNITPQSVKEIESREKTGSVTIAIMQKVAAAMNCKFEYRFVENE